MKIFYNNRLYITLILIGFFLALVGVFLGSGISTENDWAIGLMLEQYGLIAVNLFGIILLLLNGTLLKSKLLNAVILMVVLILFGYTFKILHLPFADIYLFFGLSFLMIVYIFSFYKKPKKIRLDFIKLLWVLMANTFGILILLHIIDGYYATIPNYILWLALIDFIITGWRDKTLFQPSQK